MTFDSIITIAAFCCYLIFMLCIGMYFVGKNRTTNEYFLGGRQLGSWVTGLSAQASEMSGWLLMGLPGAAYLSGISAGQASAPVHQDRRRRDYAAAVLQKPFPR